MGKRESAPSLRKAIQAELARQEDGQTGPGVWGHWVLREGKQFPARGFMLLGAWLFPDPHQRPVEDNLLLTPPFWHLRPRILNYVVPLIQYYTAT